MKKEKEEEEIDWTKFQLTYLCLENIDLSRQLEMERRSIASWKKAWYEQRDIIGKLGYDIISKIALEIPLSDK
jgi:hypothetical protein